MSGVPELPPPSAMSSAETMRTVSAVPSANPTLSAKAIPPKCPPCPKRGHARTETRTTVGTNTLPVGRANNRTGRSTGSPDAEENGYQSCHILAVMTTAVTAKVSSVREMAATLKAPAVSTKAKAESQGYRRRSNISLRRIRIGVSIRRHGGRLRWKLLAESHGTCRKAEQKKRGCGSVK